MAVHSIFMVFSHQTRFCERNLEVGSFQNKYSECFQKASELQMVDEVKASTDILSKYFLPKKRGRAL